MNRDIKEFIEEDREFLSKLWQSNTDILGHAKGLKEELESNILINSHPIGREVLKLMDVLIDRQKNKKEEIEERMDYYDDLLENSDPK